MLQAKFTARIIFYVLFFVVLSFLSACDEQGTPTDTIVPIVDYTYQCEYLRWSPNGNKIAFWAPDEFFNLHVFIWDKESMDITQPKLYEPSNINNTLGIVYHQYGLCWTPDGNYLLCSVMVESDMPIYEFWQVSVKDGSTEKIEMPQGHQPKYPEVSPNGEWLTYSIKKNETWNIWKIAIKSGMPITIIGDPIQLTFDGGWYSRWSPDGTLLAYNNDPIDYEHIYTISASGGPPIQITFGGVRDQLWLTWSPDAAWLAYSYNPNGGPYELWKIPSVGGTPQQITDYGDIFPMIAGDLHSDWSPDGDWIAFTSQGYSSDYSIFLVEMQ